MTDKEFADLKAGDEIRIVRELVNGMPDREREYLGKTVIVKSIAEQPETIDHDPWVVVDTDIYHNLWYFKEEIELVKDISGWI
jgi:hypothetical protein